MSDIQVSDNADEQRFEVSVDGRPAGFAAYIATPEMIVFTHTEVDGSYEGQGVGSALVRAALDEVRARKLKVLAVCPFVLAWIQRHPDYADLQHNAPRSRVTD